MNNIIPTNLMKNCPYKETGARILWCLKQNGSQTVEELRLNLGGNIQSRQAYSNIRMISRWTILGKLFINVTKKPGNKGKNVYTLDDDMRKLPMSNLLKLTTGDAFDHHDLTKTRLGHIQSKTMIASKLLEDITDNIEKIKLKR
jgi:hypothetical protein